MNAFNSFVQWSNVKDYIKTNYNIQRETEDFISMGFKFNDGRSQMVFIERNETASGLETVEVSSRIGEISSRRLDLALEKVSKMVFGGMSKLNNDYFIRNCVMLNAIDLEGLALMIQILAMTADEFEKEFVGGDDN